MFQGGEAGELLGIAGAFMCAIRYSRQFRSYVFRIDSINAIKHIFEEQDVTSAGAHLLPGIMLCWCSRRRLLELGRDSRAVWIAHDQNPAHKVAYAEQRRRHDGNWLCGNDYAPTYFPEAHKRVFQNIAHNVQYGVTHRGVGSDALACVDGMDAV